MVKNKLSEEQKNAPHIWLSNLGTMILQVDEDTKMNPSSYYNSKEGIEKRYRDEEFLNNPK